MKRSCLVPLAAIAAVALYQLGTATPAAAQDAVRSDFLAACAKGIMENNPIWSDDQLEQLCDCRFGLFDANLSREDITLLTNAINSGDRWSLPERINVANLEYVGTCHDEWRRSGSR